MNFFKRLFSKNKKIEPTPAPSIPSPPPPPPPPPPPTEKAPPNFSIQIKDDEDFNNRFRPLINEDDAKLLAGSVGMISNFSKLSQLELPNTQFQNHPENLDFVTQNGYLNWMKSVGMGDGDIAAQLCFSLSEYMMKQHEMTLYHDHLPEYKFRMFTLKKIVNDIHIYVYPLEFTVKVLNEGQSFVDFEKMVMDQESEMQ
ncbi:MAG: hypothetical protein ACI956_001170 [Nonlabens sp.]|jgi:hypothetical protein